MTQTIVALDTETFPIGPGNVAPKMVCVTAAYRDEAGQIVSTLLGNHPDDGAEEFIAGVVAEESIKLVLANGAYDFAVLARSYPTLIPLLFANLWAGRVTDVQIREKLLNLSTSGGLENAWGPDGTKEKLSYSLVALELAYLGIDRSGDKQDADAWRMHYQTLDGWLASEYPEDAAAYALADAEGTLRVWEAQEQRRGTAQASTATEEFQAACAFALQLETAWGMEVNPENVREMRAGVEKILEANEGQLVEAGILRPAVLSAPYKRSVNKAAGLLEAAGRIVEGTDQSTIDWEEHREFLEGMGIKFIAGKKSSKDMKTLRAYAEVIYKRLGVIPAMTDGGEKGEPQIQLDAEAQELLAPHDPVMACFQNREAIAKIKDNQLPILESAGVIHFNYDILKETGRTSSYGGGRNGKKPLYPSANGQQVPKEIENLNPRGCYRPRAGTVFWDVDYVTQELACVGQVTHDLFGESVHLERYNAGVDLHGYLGAQLALQSSDHPMGVEFASACRAEGILSDPMAVYAAFLACKKHEDKEVREFFKHFRTFAKPVGLGFPGGLGPATMVDFARTTYGVIMSEEQAREFRDMWREVYPEMPRYFDWVNAQVDHRNDRGTYWYESPLGMIRRGATFCAAANGKAMQTPGAEVSKAANFLVVRAAYDWTQQSILLGTRPIAFVHDQIIGETTRDEATWHEQAMEVARIMEEASLLVLPDVKMRTEPLLTRVWSKAAEPTFDDAGRLIPWTPEATDGHISAERPAA